MLNAVLSKLLTPANYEDVLARATHKSKREIEILARELDPKPDVAPSIRKRPQPKARPAPPPPSDELSPGRVEPEGQKGQEVPASNPAPREKPAKVEPLAPARYKVLWRALHKTFYGERRFMESPSRRGILNSFGEEHLSLFGLHFAPHKR